MGRHSAPDTDEGRLEPQAPEPGRVEAEPVEPEPAPTAPAVSDVHPARGALGDLQLLRSDTRLMLTCAGAIVLIFLVYTSVLILMGRTDVYLIWVWIPTVLSGMTLGGLLDRAHRKVGEHPDQP